MGRDARLKAMRKSMRDRSIKLGYHELPLSKPTKAIPMMQQRIYLFSKRDNKSVSVSIADGRELMHKRDYMLIARQEYRQGRLDERQRPKVIVLKPPDKKPLKQRVSNIRNRIEGKFLPILPSGHKRNVVSP